MIAALAPSLPPLHVGGALHCLSITCSEKVFMRVYSGIIVTGDALATGAEPPYNVMINIR